MPGKTGFDMHRTRQHPHVIFTTAYDEYALKAFEVNALDYLVKPVEPKRTGRRHSTKLQQAEEKNKLRPWPVSTGVYFPKRPGIREKDGERCWFIKLGDVRLFESVNGNYATRFLRHLQTAYFKILNALEERLDEKFSSGQT